MPIPLFQFGGLTDCSLLRLFLLVDNYRLGETESGFKCALYVCLPAGNGWPQASKLLTHRCWTGVEHAMNGKPMITIYDNRAYRARILHLVADPAVAGG